MKWHKRFFWLLLLFLPTQLGYHFWPEWATVLGRRVDYLAPTVYLTDFLLFATLLFWFKESISKKYTPSFILYSLFFILIGTNIYGADNQMVAIYKWLKAVEFVLLGWYIVRTKPKLSTIITPLSIGVFYSSVLAIAQFFLQHSIGGPLWWLGERTFTLDTPGIARIALNWSPASPAGGLGFGHWDFGLKLRPYATFPHPNVLGGFLAAVLPLVIISREAGSRSARQFSIFKIITIVVGVIALLLTFSRSAIVVGTIAIAIAIARNVENKLRVVGTVLVVFVLTSYVLRLTSTEESVVVRQQLNVAAIKLWQSSPLFGVGLGNFLVRLPEALPFRTIYFLQPVHNIYLLLLSEIGAVGIAGVVGVVWVAIRKKKRVLFVPLIAYLLLGFVDHYPLTLQQGQLLLTVLAARAVLSVH